VLAGLGESRTIQKVRITWPDGQSEDRTDVPIDRYTTIVQGGAQ
jgi:hypothetical protein